MPKKKKAKGAKQQGVAKAAAGNPTPKRYSCHFPTPDRDLPLDFVKAIHDLEATLHLPVWLLVQGGGGDWDFLGSEAICSFRSLREMGLKRGEKVALLIDSRGGSARNAYEIASLLRRHCGGFVAVVPRLAKSAATMLALGADDIILGEYGELGPLDVQVLDPEREEWISGLDEVQSLERLNAFAMSAIDGAMFLFANRTGMKAKTLLPHVTRFVTELTGPLFSRVDVVHYTQMSRALKEGEQYAERLLGRNHSREKAHKIACALVENYPEHGFIIDSDEAKSIGLHVSDPTMDQLRIMDEVAKHLHNMTAIGRITERPVP